MATKPLSKKSAGTAGSLTGKVRALNRYREQFNPIVGLTVQRARYLFESYLRGDYADLMWTYGAPMVGVENADADLLALIERRTSAVLEMDWQIKTKAIRKDADGKILKPVGFDAALANEQTQALDEAYESIDNLDDAIEHLCLASFRGFSHLEKFTNPDGDVYHLEIVDQWNVVRDGLHGDWKYNPTASPNSFTSLPGENLMDPVDFIIREIRRPINRIALLKFIRNSVAEKDWDFFMEIYGIPSGVVTMPQNVPVDRESEYLATAREISEGGHGALPHDSTYTPNDTPHGVNPFKERLEFLSEKLILAGTGGLLTMLTHSGSGTLAGSAHMETFAKLARKEAKAVGALFQRHFDAAILEKNFTGKPPLAYFELCFAEETDTSDYVDGVQKLSTAGYQVSAEQITEKTGYQVSVKADPPPAKEPAASELRKAPLKNRASADPQLTGHFLARCRDLFSESTAQDLQPMREALEQVLGGDDLDGATALYDQLPDLADEIIANIGNAESLYRILSTAAAEGLAGATLLKNTGTSAGSAKGWETRRANGWTPKAPRRITATLADKALQKGFTVADSSGKKIRFGKELKKKLDSYGLEGNRRKELLKWGRDTVRTGKFSEQMEKGERRTHYGKVYQAGGKNKGFMVIVDTQDGYAFNMHIAKPSQVARKTTNRANTGEQPPAGVLQAIAAASGSPDWLILA